MPSEQCVWLHDQESLLPRANQLGQQDQEDAIGVRACWPFYLTLENGVNALMIESHSLLEK
jgi:hypothetical protein